MADTALSLGSLRLLHGERMQRVVLPFISRRRERDDASSFGYDTKGAAELSMLLRALDVAGHELPQRSVRVRIDAPPPVPHSLRLHLVP